MPEDSRIHALPAVQQPVEEPHFPITNVQVSPQGVIVTTVLGPGLSITQGLGEAVMNDVVKKWLDTRRELKKQQALIQDVMRSKNN